MEQEVKKEPNRIFEFFQKTLNGMAIGLFATLIIGTIFATIGQLFAYGKGNGFCDFMAKIIGDGTSGFSYVLEILTGAGIGIGIAFAMKCNPLKTVILGVVGMIAAYFSLTTKFVTAYNPDMHFGGLKVGDPLTIYLVVASTSILLDLISKKETKVDFILLPLIGILIGVAFSLGVRYPAIYVTYSIQWLVNAGTNTVPLIMGIVVAVIMGMALTAPISSAAIAAMVFVLPQGASITDPQYTGLVIASGAAVIGCSTQMIGFMVQSRKDNNLGTLISIGIGTSMLQFKNILKKPAIWLPTIIASAILGPISTCWLHVTCLGSAAGMGTAGLVGQIGTLASMGADSWQAWVGVIGLEIVLPAILVWALDLLFRKFEMIKDGDLKI